MKRIVQVLVVLTVMLTMAAAASAQFPSPTPVFGLKWAQPPVKVGDVPAPIGSNLPIPIFYGWDERSYTAPPGWKPVRLGDDWLCMSDKPVTEIVWWGSYSHWLGTAPPRVKPVGFRLEMFTDVPASATAPFSHPGESVWSYTTFDVPEVPVGYDKDPRTGGMDSTFMYDVVLPRDDWFNQNSIIQPSSIANESAFSTFWLCITPIYSTGQAPNPWGWKTREHFFQDDAVKEVLDPAGWSPIYVPAPLGQRVSWDLAFRLISNADETPPPPPLAAVPAQASSEVKWDQSPVPIPGATFRNGPVFDGWDETAAVQVAPQSQAADDWLCTSKAPVTGIRWWGSYPGWGERQPPKSPDRFFLGIYSDIPAGNGVPFSHPGKLLWQWTTRYYQEQFVGYDTTDRTAPFDLVDSCYVYQVPLPQFAWFQQQPGPSAGNRYWLSVRAVFDDLPPYEWGWKTRPHFFGDDAVKAGLGAYLIGWTRIFGPDKKGWDLAFDLTTAGPLQ